jgi:hypothetical protein
MRRRPAQCLCQRSQPGTNLKNAAWFINTGKPHEFFRYVCVYEKVLSHRLWRFQSVSAKYFPDRVYVEQLTHFRITVCVIFSVAVFFFTLLSQSNAPLQCHIMCKYNIKNVYMSQRLIENMRYLFLYLQFFLESNATMWYNNDGVLIARVERKTQRRDAND